MLYKIIRNHILYSTATRISVISCSSRTTTEPGTKKKVLRIAINSIASPFWDVTENSSVQLYTFLHKLKSLVRNTYATVMITIPAYLYDDFNGHGVDPLIKRAEYAVDGILEVESFTGSPHPLDPKYTSDYHGFIHPHMLFQVDSLLQTTRLSAVERHSLGFKVRRKRFSIEPFILPPDMDQETDSKHAGVLKSTKTGCGESNKDPLAF
jgi:elongator complex protein 4